MTQKAMSLSPFGSLVSELCAEKGFTLHRLGRELKLPSNASINLAIQPHRDGKRNGLLSPERIDELADLFECDAETRFKLHVLGAAEFAPAVLSSYIAKLERELSTSFAKQGKTPPVFMMKDRQILMRSRPSA